MEPGLSSLLLTRENKTAVVRSTESGVIPKKSSQVPYKNKAYTKTTTISKIYSNV